MRSAIAIKSTLPLALAAALLALPAANVARAQVTLAGEPAAAAPAKMAGIYRVTLTSSSIAAQKMHMLVRLGDHGYTCVLLAGDKEMPIEDLRLEGDVIRGRAATSLGKGEIVLVVSEEGVSGTLTVGSTRVNIAGERIG